MKAELWKVMTDIRGNWILFGRKLYEGRRKARTESNDAKIKYPFARFKVVKA
jgi:hypothetical protein